MSVEENVGKFFIGTAAVIGAVALFIICCVIGIAGSFLEAWVATRLWEWYVMPAFAVGELSLLSAFGISLLVTMVINQPDLHRAKDAEYQWAGMITHTFVRPLMCLFVGWVGVTYIKHWL